MLIILNFEALIIFLNIFRVPKEIDKIGIQRIPDDVARDRYYNESLEEYENTKHKEEEEGRISIFGKSEDFTPRIHLDNDNEDEDLYT